MRAAIYDMDLTITSWPTYTRWLVFWAWREAPWRLALLPGAAAAGAAYRLGLMSRAQVKQVAQRLLMGPSVERGAVAAVAADFAATVALRPGALRQLAADRAAGLEIIMATASFAFYADAIADRLGIASVVATGSQWEGDRLRPRLVGDNCYGVAKLAMIVARWPEVDVVRAYSDHRSDAPLLDRAGEAYAVNPSRGLRLLARRRGWRIVDWR